MKTDSYHKSLLYKITSPTGSRYAYLLGTMHMVCAEDFFIKPKILSALKKCNKYYMEVDLGNPDEINSMNTGNESLQNLSNGLTEEETGQLENLLHEKWNLPIESVDEYSPLELINQMTIDAMGCKDFKIPEIELVHSAVAMGIASGGLETAIEQFQIAQKVFTGKEMLHQLKSADGYQDIFEQIAKAYREENLADLALLVTDKRFMSRRAYQILVNGRNKRWSKAIPKIMTRERPFFAVGAGHLPGIKGVIRLLQEQGFKVNPVYR